MKKRFAALLTALTLLAAPALAQQEPQLNDQGFLSDPEGEYIQTDEDAGLWVYLSGSLSVRVTRYQEEGPLEYYVADVLCSPESPLQTVTTSGRVPGRKLVSPKTLAEESGAVLALTDDFYGFRMQKKQTVGIIVRSGQALSNKTRSSRNQRGWPNLDTLAVYQDGRMEANVSDARKADDYVADGATNVFAFGPVLLKDGQVTDYVMQDDYYPYREPRLAIGMVEPYHYIVLAVVGRDDDSKGARISWVAQKLKELGVQEALNLDGGGTAALFFMGQVLNRSPKNMRSVGSLITFGRTSASE